MANTSPSNPDYSIDLPLQGYDYNWNCAVGLIPAKSGVALEFQYLEFTHTCVYFDFNETRLLGLNASVATTNFIAIALQGVLLLKNSILLVPTAAPTIRTEQLN